MLAPALVARPSTAVAQTSPVEPPPVFGEVLDVRVVEIDVTVTRDGEPVEGLARDAFTLEVDGRAVPIQWFREVRDGREAAASRLQSPDVAASDVAAADVVASPTGRPIGRRFLVFVDDYFAMPEDRDRVLDALEDQLDRLRPEDRMAIVAWEGRQVELLTGWTSSRPLLRAALDAARARPAFGLQRRSEARQVEALLRYRQRASTGRSFTSIGFNGSRAAGRRESAEVLNVETLDEVRSRLRRLASAAAATLRGFGSPSGRDVMLFLAGGLPATEVEAYEAVRNLEIRGDVPDPWNAEELMQPLLTTANRLGWTVYPVALDRFEARHLADASIGDPDVGAFAAARARARTDLLTDGLRETAAATGGRVLLDGAATRALDLVSADTRSYYSLGFTPAWQGDDSFHEVEIRVVPASGGRSLEVRARSGYTDLSASTRIAMQVESAHLFGAPLEGGEPLLVNVGEPSPAGFRRMRVPVRMDIPLDRIEPTIAADGSWSATLEMMVLGSDDRGDGVELSLPPLELRGPIPPRPGESLPVDTQLELRRRPHDLFLALYDPGSARLLGVRMRVEP